MRQIRRFYFLFSAYFLGGYIFSFAQSSELNEVDVFSRPAAFIHPDGLKVAYELPKTASSQDNLWVVYSDRTGNVARSRPEYSAPVQSNLDFMQAALVIEEKGGWLRLVEYKTNWCPQSRFKKLCAPIIVLGWVEKEKLLMWEVPLHTSTNKYMIKGLAISTAADLMELTQSEDQTHSFQDKLKLFDDPELQVRNKSDFRIFNFLFIFKMEGSSYLVGKDHIIRSYRGNAKQSILGWVDSKSIRQWRYRICLEPTKDQFAERKQAGMHNALFEKESDAMNYSMEGTLTTEPIWKKMLSSRPRPGIKRLPILDSKTAGFDGRLVQTGVVTPIYNKQGDEVWSEEDYANVSLSKEQRDAENSKVNLIFVVEDSQDMGIYMPKVHDMIMDIGKGLKQKQDNLSLLEKPFEFSIGFVLYRQDDADACGGKSVLPYTPQPDDYKKVAAAFNNKNEQGSCGNSNTYALLKALEEALNFVKKREYQNNLIVVAGFNANQASDYERRKSALIDRLDSTNTSLLVFQPVNPGNDDFQDQLSFLQMEAMKKESIFVAQRYAIKIADPTLKKVPEHMNLFAFDCPEESPLPGVFMFADKSNKMDGELMKKIVTDMVEKSQKQKEKTADESDAFMRGQGERPLMNAGMRHYLASMNIDVENLKKLDYNNVQLFVEGWTSTNAGSSKVKLYKYVVFLTGQEFADYLDAMAKLNDVKAADVDLRQSMKTQFEKLAKTYAGAKESKGSSITIADVFKNMTDVPPESKDFNVPISQINSMTDEAFNRMRSSLEIKYQGLKRYYDDKNNAYSVDGLSYYWVPVEYFPR